MYKKEHWLLKPSVVATLHAMRHFPEIPGSAERIYCELAPDLLTIHLFIG